MQVLKVVDGLDSTKAILYWIRMNGTVSTKLIPMQVLKVVDGLVRKFRMSSQALSASVDVKQFTRQLRSIISIHAFVFIREQMKIHISASIAVMDATRQLGTDE